MPRKLRTSLKSFVYRHTDPANDSSAASTGGGSDNAGQGSTPVTEQNGASDPPIASEATS